MALYGGKTKSAAGIGGGNGAVDGASCAVSCGGAFTSSTFGGGTFMAEAAAFA